MEPSFSDQISFFLNVAVIGATLFGLTLVALVGFLPLHVERFRQTALPAFPDIKKADYERGRSKLFSLSDRQIIDGDPLVFFTAYSVGTAWSFFTLPIALGLTMAWPIKHLFICGLEMIALTGLLGWALWGRNRSLKKLTVYMTNEERAWPALAVVVIIMLVITSLAIIVLDARGIQLRWVVVGMLKGVCIGSLLLGTYVLNKEVFIYFKANAVERLRTAWLDQFLRGHKKLEHRVNERLANRILDSEIREELKDLWNGGLPTLRSAHDEFRSPLSSKSLEQMWYSMLHDGAGGYAWVVDVPEIASWSNRIEELLHDEPKEAAESLSSQRPRDSS